MSEVHPMLRKVAEALAWRDCSGLRARSIISESKPWQDFLPDARAAVQALLEPDEGQYDAGYDATRLSDGTSQFADAGFCLGHAGKIYQAMLKPLLGDERQPVPGVYGPDQHAAGFVAKEVG